MKLNLKCDEAWHTYTQTQKKSGKCLEYFILGGEQNV